MDELLEQFLIEGRDLVAEAHGALFALGRDRKDRAALDALFRATHTLKGSVALFDMAPAEQLLHSAETRLDSARKGVQPLDDDVIDILVAIIDQTDRWIDAMGDQGALAPDAAKHSARLIGQIAEAPERQAPQAATDLAQTSDWIATLRQRPEFADVEQAPGQIAFRYTPDPDCFFRGEDPLAIANGVADLVALAVLPPGENWPPLSACEPFRCMAVIEGISTAAEAAVRAAFRLVPDQIVTGPFAASASVTSSPEDQRARETMTLRVDAARLDRLADQSSELAAAIRALTPIARQLRGTDPQLAAKLAAAEEIIERLTGTLQRSVAQIRLISLEPILRRLPRLARDAAASTGKPVRFTWDGETVQVDKQIADQIFEPLLHLVRNAIDHGIEPAEEREAQGKPAEGRVHLSVQQEGESVAFTLTDDGRGIDAAHIRLAAVQRGVIDRDAAKGLNDAEARRLIFLPGFSTASNTSSISGRGVGMDAVRAAVGKLAGTITVDSEAGKGTCIRLLLPANAISTPLLIIGTGDQQLGIRFDQIVETTRIDARAIQPVGQGRACVLRDATVPVVDLAEILGLGTTSGDLARLVVTDAGPTRTALRVGHFGERFDAVVRESNGLLAAIPSVAGTATLADGSVLLVLDLPELIG